MFEIAACNLNNLEEVSRLNLIVQSIHSREHPDLFKSDVSLPEVVKEFASALEDPNQNIFIAFEADRIVGYIWSFYYEKKETTLNHSAKIVNINHICVDPEYTGKGVGSKLIKQVELLAESRGASRVALDFWCFNDTAAKFFLSRGFSAYNIKMWKLL